MCVINTFLKSLFFRINITKMSAKETNLLQQIIKCNIDLNRDAIEVCITN